MYAGFRMYVLACIYVCIYVCKYIGLHAYLHVCLLPVYVTFRHNQNRDTPSPLPVVVAVVAKLCSLQGPQVERPVLRVASSVRTCSIVCIPGCVIRTDAHP